MTIDMRALITGVILAIASIVILLIWMILSTQKSLEKGEDLEVRIKCIGDHQYYYAWQGGTNGGPALAPVLDYAGKPVECRNSIKIVE